MQCTGKSECKWWRGHIVPLQAQHLLRAINELWCWVVLASARCGHCPASRRSSSTSCFMSASPSAATSPSTKGSSCASAARASGFTLSARDARSQGPSMRGGEAGGHPPPAPGGSSAQPGRRRRGPAGAAVGAGAGPGAGAAGRGAPLVRAATSPACQALALSAADPGAAHSSSSLQGEGRSTGGASFESGKNPVNAPGRRACPGQGAAQDHPEKSARPRRRSRPCSARVAVAPPSTPCAPGLRQGGSHQACSASTSRASATALRTPLDWNSGAPGAASLAAAGTRTSRTVLYCRPALQRAGRGWQHGRADESNGRHLVKRSAAAWQEWHAPASPEHMSRARCSLHHPTLAADPPWPANPAAPSAPGPPVAVACRQAQRRRRCGGAPRRGLHPQQHHPTLDALLCLGRGEECVDLQGRRRGRGRGMDRWWVLGGGFQSGLALGGREARARVSSRPRTRPAPTRMMLPPPESRRSSESGLP